MFVQGLFISVCVVVLCCCDVLGAWRWRDKVAVVTGASSGIGAEIALRLADKGMIVAAIARREQRLKELIDRSTGNIQSVICDLRKEDDIINAFKWIESNLGGVDVLINNAGVLISSSFSSLNTDDWRATFDLNVLGMALSSREALKTMRSRGDDGHIININSVLGHKVVDIGLPIYNLYTSSKFAVRAMSEALAHELSDAGSKIKVTNLSPGLVLTELATNASESSTTIRERINKMNHIDVEDIAEGVIYILNNKPNVHISELTIRQIDPPKTC